MYNLKKAIWYRHTRPGKIGLELEIPESEKRPFQSCAEAFPGKLHDSSREPPREIEESARSEIDQVARRENTGTGQRQRRRNAF